MQIRTAELMQGPLSLKYEEQPETFPVLAEMVSDGICEFPAPLMAAL